MNPTYYEVYRTIGINIAHYRNLRDLSQGELCQKVGIEQSHMSKIERAAIGISIDNLCKIADALQVEPYQLIKPLE